MKLHAGTNVVEKSSSFEESKFSIEASSKAFFILSDGLYSNKVLAVVRELSTNAYDSHIEAKKSNVPFDVHLPTALNPIFFIRDYGTSMNHADCMQLYTTYFRSTRNNSNDAVGCLGLGSKAPFAYSDSFVVEAYLDGKCRTYNAHKDANANPTFILMNECNTNEPNGIKVSIMVNSSDIDRFRKEAEKVYEFFTVKPNFIGAEKITYSETKKILGGDTWYFDGNSNENFIIMGQIAYPLYGHELSSNVNEHKYRRFVEYSNGLRVFVKIGDVDITPSRESLSYSKETRENICNIIDNIISDIKTKIEGEIANQNTLFKARIKYIEISDQCDSIKNAMESLQSNVSWNGTKLFDNPIGEYIDVKNKISCIKLNKTRYRKKIDTEHKVERFYFGKNVKFIIDNLNRGGISRIKQALRDKYEDIHCYVYKLDSVNETVDNCALLDIMGGASKQDVVVTSDLPKVTYNRSNSGSSGSDGPIIQIQIYNEESGHFENCDMSVKYENAYYFAESKGYVKMYGRDVEISSIESVLSYIHENHADDVDGITFYAVKPSVIKNRKLDSRENWHDASGMIKQTVTSAVESNKDRIINCYRRINLSKNSNYRWKEVFELTETDNEAKRVIAEYNEYTSKVQKDAESMHTLHSLATVLNVNPITFSNINLEDNSFANRFDNEMAKYPMLKVANIPWRDSDKKIIAEYIDTIERSNNMADTLSSM